MHRTIHIIEAPSNLGLKEPAQGKEPGVNKLPGWLKKHGFYDRIKPDQIVTLAAPPYSMYLDKESRVRNADKIAAYSLQLSQLIESVVVKKTFSLVIGGDCSILLGPMLALKNRGNYGLFYLDGHTDFVLPEQSQTGGAAGMDLAIVTGYGHDKLTNIINQKPYIAETNVWCVGNRYLEENYVHTITSSGIHYYDLYQLRQMGIEICIKHFLEMIAAKQLTGFWIHLDVDVLNDTIMPAVDSRQKDGLSYAELQIILEGLLQSEKAIGMNITILDPNLDPTGKVTSDFIEHISPVFEKYSKNGF